MRDATLREALHTLSAYGASIIVRAGANSPFGEEGRRIAPGLLLAALLPEEAERPVILTWDTPPRGYILGTQDAIGWLYVFTAPGKIQEAPVLFVYEAPVSADRRTDRREEGE